MQFELLNNQTVKVILEKIDLQGFNLLYNQIDKNNINTQLLFISILDEILEKTGVDFTDKNLYFELFPTKNSGCLIYISIDIDSQPETDKNEQDYIYFYLNLNELIELSQYTVQMCRIFNCKSSLYYCHRGFYLILSILSKYEIFMRSIITKMGDPISRGEINYAYIKEHFECIANSNAIEKLAEIKTQYNYTDFDNG